MFNLELDVNARAFSHDSTQHLADEEDIGVVRFAFAGDCDSEVPDFPLEQLLVAEDVPSRLLLI